MMRHWCLAILWVALMTACGGADEPSKSPAGVGGEPGVGGDPDTDEVPAEQQPDGSWVCPRGMALYKADDPAPTCRVDQQSTTIPDEGSEPLPEDASLPDPPEPDAATPEPDAEPSCHDWTDQICEQRGERDPCILIPRMSGNRLVPCQWDCGALPDGEPRFLSRMTDDTIPIACPNLATE